MLCRDAEPGGMLPPLMPRWGEGPVNIYVSVGASPPAQLGGGLRGQELMSPPSRGPPGGGGQGIVRIHLNRLSGIGIPANVKKCVICFFKRLLIYVWRAGLSWVIVSRSTDRAGKAQVSSEGGRLGEGGVCGFTRRPTASLE